MKPYPDSYPYLSLHPTLFHVHHLNDHMHSLSHFLVLVVAIPVHVQEEGVPSLVNQVPKAYPASRMVGIRIHLHRSQVRVVLDYVPLPGIRVGLLYLPLPHHRVVEPSSSLVGMPSEQPS
jgi:hypothetical protein